MTTINPNSPTPTDPNLYGTQDAGASQGAAKTQGDTTKAGSSQHIKLDVASLDAAKGSSDAPITNWAPSDVVWRNLGDLESVIDSQQFDIQALLAVLIKFAASVSEATKNNRFDAALAAEALGLAAAQDTRDSAQLQKTAGAVSFALSTASATVSIAGGLHAAGSVVEPGASTPSTSTKVDGSSDIPTGGPNASIPGELSSTTSNIEVGSNTTTPATPTANQAAGQGTQTTTPSTETPTNEVKTETPDTASQLKDGGGGPSIENSTQTETTDTDVSEPKVENTATGKTTQQEVKDAQTSKSEETSLKRAQTELETQKAAFKNVKIQGELQIYQGVSTLLDGVGNLVKSQLEGDATIAQARSQEKNARAEVRKAVQQSENSYVEEWQQFQQKVLQLAEKVQDVQHRVTERIYS